MAVATAGPPESSQPLGPLQPPPGQPPLKEKSLKEAVAAAAAAERRVLRGGMLLFSDIWREKAD